MERLDVEKKVRRIICKLSLVTVMTKIYDSN